jgi:hypothetical protein
MQRHNFLSNQWREYSAAIPGLTIKYKSDTLWWRVFPRPVREATTTLGKTIYLPSGKWLEASEERAFAVLAHEFQHALDRQRLGFWGFYLRYAFPQILGLVPLLGALVSLVMFPWWASVGLFALTVLAIMPWRSSTRLDIERRGYAMTCAVDFLLYGKIREYTREHVLSAFAGWFYLRMASMHDALTLFHEIEENVTGPRWPRGLAAFAPTVGAMLESNAVCDVAREAYRWPTESSAAAERGDDHEQGFDNRQFGEGPGTEVHTERNSAGQI